MVGAGLPLDVLVAMQRLGIVAGHSRAFADTLRHAATVACTDDPVLMLGASGTGKTTLAKLLHATGPRPSAPFVYLNLPAVPAALLTSVLHGDRYGATCKAAGGIETARDGTILFLEIGGLGAAAWRIVLDFLRNRAYWHTVRHRPATSAARIVLCAYPAGSDAEHATNVARARELIDAVRTTLISLPTLAERRDDIASLAQHMVRGAVARRRLARVRLAASALAALEAAEWPGNVRQLEDAVEAAAVRADDIGAPEIRPEHLSLR